MTAETASRVVVSYPADLSGWGRDQLETPWFRAYLRRTLRDVEVGETVEVFLDVGCCGDSLDVPLRVERREESEERSEELVEGEGPDDVQAEGDEVAEEGPSVEYEEREACGLAGGWLVQSRAGPSRTG